MTVTRMDIEIAGIVSDVSRSRKYRHVCPATIARIATRAAAASRSPKEAVKRTKRKLHQTHGAYLARWDDAKLAALSGQIAAGAGLDDVKPLCRAIMAQHASTRERLAVLPQLYQSIFRITGVPRTVLDLGCGLHPFGLSWMNLPPDARYAAWDIDRRIVDLINAFFGRGGFTGEACWRDLCDAGPDDQADVVFLLKMLPCLEQQERGSAGRLLRAIEADFIVTSFPARSLGGRHKGMPAHYSRMMEKIVSGSAWRVASMQHGQELFFIIQKSGTRP